MLEGKLLGAASLNDQTLCAKYNYTSLHMVYERHDSVTQSEKWYHLHTEQTFGESGPAVTASLELLNSNILSDDEENQMQEFWISSLQCDFVVLINRETQTKKTKYQSAEMYLNEEECLEEEVKEHVCDDLTDAGERLRFTSRHFKCQVSYILQQRITHWYLCRRQCSQTATKRTKNIINIRIWKTDFFCFVVTIWDDRRHNVCCFCVLTWF